MAQLRVDLLILYLFCCSTDLHLQTVPYIFQHHLKTKTLDDVRLKTGCFLNRCYCKQCMESLGVVEVLSRSSTS